MIKSITKLSISLTASLLILVFVIGGQASAAVTGYVNNVQTNSANWTSAVNLSGGAMTNLNFNDLPIGALPLVTSGNYALNGYQASYGVTFKVQGNAPSIVNGVGPGDTGSYQLNPGEGAHPASNYLSFPPHPGYSGGYVTSITLNFAEEVAAVGFLTIGLNNSFTPGINRLTIEAFTGQNATGTSLGVFISPDAYNFNPNNLFFMGLKSDENNIGSFQIRGSWQKALGDKVGFDDFKIATIPEPATLSLLAASGLGMIIRRSRKAA